MADSWGRYVTFCPEEFSALNAKSLERVVSSVNAWYDARSFPQVIVPHSSLPILRPRRYNLRNRLVSEIFYVL